MSTRIPITSPEHDRPEPAAHTPGPWHAATTDEGELIIDLRPQCKGHADIIIIGDLEDTSGEDHANADLIAAAPDLLAACKALIEWTEVMYPMWDLPNDLPIVRIAQTAADAIDKATGQVPA